VRFCPKEGRGAFFGPKIGSLSALAEGQMAQRCAAVGAAQTQFFLSFAKKNAGPSEQRAA